jgi:unsaturated chondroitin disaccharide hydrolase
VAWYRTAIKPKGEALDESLIYGDYYFVEALLRFKEQSRVSVPPSVPEQPGPPVAPAPEAPGDDAQQGGCNSAAPGPAMALAGLLLYLLKPRRQRREHV